jgi:hypothetical protein
MSDKLLNHRQKAILNLLRLGEKYALSDVKHLLSRSIRPSTATLSRDISGLQALGYLDRSGELKNSRYSLSAFGLLNAPVDAHEYCRLDLDQRSGASIFNFSLFRSITHEIFHKEDLQRMDQATQAFKDKSKDASAIIVQKELERFVIELSWKSSKIEGNTYSLLDTERLLRDGIEAPGHTKDEAIMILNHKKAFQYILTHFKSAQKISLRDIENIHSILVDGLGVSFGIRKMQVGVTGSSYRPLFIQSQIKEAVEDLCDAMAKMKTPYSKALLALLGISYIQPFEDGNKRSARLLANAILLSYDCAPLSYRGVDEILYKESTLVFYEKNSLIPMSEIFIDQYLFACEQYLQF